LDEKGNHIDFFTCHCLRDTFATRFIEQGGNPQTLKTILGHSSLSMTMDLYSHVMPNTEQKEMDNLKIVI
jgi:integrase